ncbi:hypothetical protein CRE_29151 [Caenorhabditis remanei]|uniref:Uncharacterized protein n=1 Tax=Caenorhabditis remanei TaxID=31234 RepID=E3N4N1_CAERE|nr:hypothetical protein CRE_29151 [Caenorhabditis remanei]
MGHLKDLFFQFYYFSLSYYSTIHYNELITPKASVQTLFEAPQEPVRRRMLSGERTAADPEIYEKEAKAKGNPGSREKNVFNPRKSRRRKLTSKSTTELQILRLLINFSFFISFVFYSFVE